MKKMAYYVCNLCFQLYVLGEGSPKCCSISLARGLSWTSLKHRASFFHEWSSFSCIHLSYIILTASTGLPCAVCCILVTIAPVSSFRRMVPMSWYFTALVSIILMCCSLAVDSLIRSPMTTFSGITNVCVILVYS